jgi:hypothetical protein
MKNLRTAGDPAKIRTQLLPNTSLQCYRYASLLGDTVEIMEQSYMTVSERNNEIEA